MLKALVGMPTHLEGSEEILLGRDLLDYISINTPPVCNYRCHKCFTWANKNPTQNYLGTGRLLDVLSEARQQGAKVVGLLGEGEPTLFSDFRKIISHISGLGMITVLATNGSLFDRELADFCFEHNVSPAISLDTLDEAEYHEQCGGASDLAVVLSNISYARQRFAAGIRVKNGIKLYRLAVHMTVHADNYRNVNAIADFCGEDLYFSCEHIAKVGVANENPGIYGGNRDYRIYDTVRKKAHAIMRPMVIAEGKAGVPATCCFFYYGVSLGYDGEIMLDTHAIETKKKIGNLAEFRDLAHVVAESRRLKKLFYEKYGSNYCLIRDDNYPEFIKKLEEL